MLAVGLLVAAHLAASTTVASLREQGNSSPTRPVHVRGVVTAFSGWKNSFFLQDATSGISVDRLEQTKLQPGDEVEVTGTVRPGLFAPVLVSDAIQVLGQRPLPKPRVSTYLELSRGHLDSWLVEVTGVVHSARVDEMWGRPVLLLDLHTLDGGELTVHVMDFSQDFLSNLVDSTIVVRGVCGTVFNSRQQLVGVRIFVPNANQIERELAPVEPFHLPLSSLASLLRFNPGPAIQHRVRVAGTVTFQLPGSLLYLQSGGLGIRVETTQSAPFPPGSQVEAFGFVAADGYSATLQNAVVRLVSAAGKMPEPIRVHAAQVIGTKDGFPYAPYDGVLVRVEGRIVERIPQAHSQLWLAQGLGKEGLVTNDQPEFQAELHQADRRDGRIEPGSYATLTGVCRIETDSHGTPKSFRILLRSPDDIGILRTAHANVSKVSSAAALAVLLSAALVILCFQYRSRNAEAAPDHSLPDARPDSRMAVFSRISKIAATLSGLVGALVLFGWAAHIQMLKSIRADYPSMKANAAFCLLTASASILLAQRPVARLLGAFTAAIGGLTLVEYLTGWNLHIDQALFPESGLLLSTTSPGRMGLIMAASFFLLGCALALIHSPRFTVLAQALALLTAAFSLLSINCYLYGIHNFEGLAVYAGSAVHTAACVLLLCLAILCSYPDRGLMGAVGSPAPGGVMAMRLLPRVLLLPSVLGWIRWEGQLQGYYDTAFGLALFTSINATCFVFLIWSTASRLNRLDQTRLLADAEVRRLNETLEARVAQRTAELEASEERFSSIIDAVKDYSIITLDPEGRVTSWNSGAERQKGYRAEEILGKHLSTFYSPEEQERGVADQELALAKSQGECRQEGWRIGKDGRRFWANALITSVWNSDGSLRGFSKITQDITEQMLARERFRAVVEAAPNAFMMASADGKIALVNRQTEKLFGYSRDELMGRPAEILLSGRLFGAGEARNFSVRRELAGVRKDGSKMPIEIGLNRIETGEGSFVLASIIDISERKKAEKMLRDQALIIDRASETIFISDQDDRITYWNQGAQRLYGWSKEEALGQVSHQLLQTRFPKPLEQLTAQLIADGHWNGELVQTRRDGSLVTVTSAWTLQRNESGDPAAVLEMNYDITERNSAQSALNEAHRMLELRVRELATSNRDLARKSEEVEAFVYIVSHDLRAPLVNLQGFAKELEMSCEELRATVLPLLRAGPERPRIHAILEEEIPDSLRYISASTSKFRRLIESLLELARYGRQPHQPEELDLDAMVRSTLDLMRLSVAASGAEITVGPLPRVRGDATGVGQVFTNLIANSLKYLQAGRPGKIEIGGELQADAVPRVVHCWVRDNGAGLPASAQARLFQVFQRFHPQLAEGEGMGLAIVKRIVERHGGRVWAEGEEGSGATFHFTLADG
jgi:PAS domain S-box-containing protein